MFKVCQKCHVEKDASAFSKSSRRKDGLQAWCKGCNNLANKKCYHTSIARKEKTKQRRSVLRLKTQEYIFEYLSNHVCIDCGESNPVCLDFDHIDGNKSGTVGEMATYSFNRMLEEIAKCVVRCANCHRKKTAKDFGWYKWRRIQI